jgi:hypothetical protein
MPEFAATGLELFVSAARDGLRKLLHLLKELFSLDEDGAGRNLLFGGLYTLLGIHSGFSLFAWKLIGARS